jgi:hypothetical protein
VKGEEREFFAQKGADCATSSDAKMNLQRLLLLDTNAADDFETLQVCASNSPYPREGVAT